MSEYLRTNYKFLYPDLIMKKLISLLLFLLLLSCGTQEEVLIIADQASPKLKFGSEKLAEVLKDAGYRVKMVDSVPEESGNKDRIISIVESADSISSGKSSNSIIEQKKIDNSEGFTIRSNDNKIIILGSGASGSLYGALELAERVKEHGKIPSQIDFKDRPEMVLRGTAIGMQKTEYLPGRGVYEYPYTPENFPWFYDKKLWIDYLDMMVENRFNSLYLWNGHPFASLVRLEDYPFAMEVSEETFKKNEEIFKFLTEEASKRGIWVIQMFYNIIVSKPFAEHYNIKTQDRSREITPLLKDYTRKSIAAFIEKYPNVGLLVALGEAMSGKENDANWFVNTIIPGVKDGMEALGRTDEPPIILRAHDTDAPYVMEKALPIYKNLYTTHKYNGESLTTYEPRGPWTEIHKNLSSLGSIHISNVHILANLEPFRWGSPDFVQKSVKAMHNIHGANGLHLYPQASYWDWPYTADKTEKRLLEFDRDWIWYKTWGRYAWKKDRDRDEEIKYWGNELADKFGTEQEAGELILKAYEESGEIAPKTLRRFGITEGNRQTLLLGMFGSQLVNPYKWRVYPGFYESCGPVGEILLEYAEKEWKNEPHVGETPPQIIEEITQHGKLAAEAIETALPSVSKDVEEFERLKNDIYAYRAFANFFSEKVKAALLILRYDKSGDISDLEKALPHLETSVVYYEDLVNLTKDTYLYANSMQTAQRRIPIGGNDGKNKTWLEMLPHYQEELDNFRNNLQLLKTSDIGRVFIDPDPWQAAEVEIISPNLPRFSMEIGKLLYPDMNAQILKFAPELKNLKALEIGEEKQLKEGVKFTFRNKVPVKVVVGYFNTDEAGYASAPTLETNAAGNQRGEAEIVLANAIKTDGFSPVHIHTYQYEAGEHDFSLNKGRALILGFINADLEIESRDVGLTGESEKEAIDWLFY